MSSLQRFAWPLLIMLALSAGAAWHVAIGQDANRRGHQLWEYHTVSGTDRLSNEELAKLGDEGWELAAAIMPNSRYAIHYFKRPK